MPNLDGNPATPTPGDNILGASYIVDGSGVGEAQLTNRRILTAGANVTLTDNGPGGTLVVAAAAGAGGYATVENNGTPVTQRTTLNLSTELAATDAGGKTALALATAGVPLAKLADLAGASVLGRSAAAPGVMAAITGVTTGHVLTVQAGPTLAFAAPSGGGGGGYATIERPNGTPLTQRAIMSFTTEFAAVDNVDTTDLSLATAGVGFSKLADLTAVSVLGRSAATTGVMAAITATNADTVLRRSGGGLLDFGLLTGLHLSGFTNTQVILGTAAGGIAGSSALTFDGTNRWLTSPTTQLGIRQTGDALGASRLEVRNRIGAAGVLLTNEGIDLCSFVFAGTSSTRDIRFEGRASSYKAGSPSWHIGNTDTDAPTLAIGDNVIRTHQNVNFTLFSASYVGITGGGLGVIGVGNASVVPATPPVAGGVMFVASGAAKWYGPSGTTTTFGPADPHCPVCGTDFMTEHENKRWGYLSVCLRCLSDELGARPWIRRERPPVQIQEEVFA